MSKIIGYLIIVFGVLFGMMVSIATTNQPTSGVTYGDKNG
jgi:hypothetical protein